MTSKALIKQSELSRMAKVAKEMGVVIEYVTDDGITIRISPSPTATPHEEKNVKSRWDYDRADVPPEPISPKFNPREYATMEHLVRLGADIRIHWRTLKNFGADTQRRLEERGYLGVSYEGNHPEKLDEVWLTQAGAKAWRAMEEHRRKWPSL